MFKMETKNFVNNVHIIADIYNPFQMCLLCLALCAPVATSYIEIRIALLD